MFSWLANAWRVPELRRRVLFTAGILAAYRLGSWIPAPGVDQTQLQSLFNGGGILSLLNLFSGSALSLKSAVDPTAAIPAHTRGCGAALQPPG